MADSMCCLLCGKSLLILRWNTSTDVLVCDNSDCRLFRRPMATSGTRPLTEEVRTTFRGPGRRPKPIRLEDFIGEEVDATVEALRRLRENLFSAKEDPEVP